MRNKIVQHFVPKICWEGKGKQNNEQGGWELGEQPAWVADLLKANRKDSVRGRIQLILKRKTKVFLSGRKGPC